MVKEESFATLCWITILGGVQIMMGQPNRWEALFYYFRLQDQVPESHVLRLSEQHIDRNHNGISVSIQFLL